ncbi:MAG: hypothetical protein JNM72_17845 [Deltaproteobacteria bacterium]|nr:hypothetical protein [Deltaproteobacteria bacterium]
MTEAAGARPQASELRAALLPLPWFAALALAQCWSVMGAPATDLLGHPRTDTLKHLWTLWWMRAAVQSEGRLPHETMLANFPEGLTLYPIEPLSGLVVNLLAPLPLPLVSNLLVFVHLVLIGHCAALLGRQLSGHWQGGLIAGTLLQTSAVTAHLFVIGVGELQQLWLLPLCLTMLLRAQANPSLGAWAKLGLCLGLSAVACFYYGLFAGLLVAAGVLWALVRGPSRLQTLGLSAVALAVIGVVVGPFAATFAESYTVAAPASADCSPVYDAVDARLELWTILWPWGFSNDPPPTAYLGGTFLGLGAVALAVVGLARQPRLAAPLVIGGLLGVVLALGSYYSAQGEELIRAGARTVLPMRWLNTALAAIAEPLNFPVRAISMTAVALAGLAALALPRKIPARWARLSAALALLPALDPTLLGQAAWPLPITHPREAPAVDLTVPGLGDSGPVADLRLAVRPDADGREAALLLQIAHGQPTQGVPISRVAEGAREGQRQLEALASVQALRAGQVPAEATLLADNAVLWSLGFRYLSWAEGWDTGPEAPTPRALRQSLGPPVTEGLGFWIWPLREPDPSVDLVALRAAHDEAVAALGEAPAAGGSLAALDGGASCPGKRAQRSDLGLLRQPPFAAHDGARVKLGGVVAWVSPPPNPADNSAELALVIHRLPEAPGAQPVAEGAIRLERPGPFVIEAPANAGNIRLSVIRGGAEGGGMPLGMLEIPVEALDRDDLRVTLHPER